MDWISLVLTAVALSMDALAVSISNGIALRKLRPWHVLKTALFFGGFQALMPLLGWLAGMSVRDAIVSFDHVVAFVLLGGLGLKMVWDNVRPASETAAVQGDPTRTRTLLLLAVATSIDALAVGISLAMTQANIWISALVIGSVTFVICCAGVLLGKRLGQLFQRRAGLVGGLVLVAIGIKILVEHISRGI